MTNAKLPATHHDTDRIERGNGRFTTEFTTLNAGERKTDQCAITSDSNLYVILWMLPGLSQSLLKKRAARFTDVTRIDDDYLFEI